jgi:glycosyltransferase involved in cell wall biosynthesis
MSGYGDNIHIHLLTRLAPEIWKVSQYPSALLWILQTRRSIKRIKPDIVHGHFITFYGSLAACSGLHPLVLTAWGSDILIHPKKRRVYKPIIKYSLKRADLITCDGENSIDAMVDLGISPEKIRIIYHGVDTQIFNFNQRNRRLIKNLFGKEDFPVVISARTLDARGNVETFTKAMPLILNKISDAKFIIGGMGPQEGYLKELAEALGVTGSVRFIGYIPHDELPEYLASSDVYVSTSLVDGGVAVATLDAMACELPPVVTDVADNSKWIKDGENGFIIPTKNPEALAQKVIYLLENEEIRKGFGRINRRLIEEKQEYAKNMEEMERLYEKLMGV